MSQNIVLNIRDLTFSYGERKALDKLTLQVSQGTIFGLLGPNGSGKTTLFRLLTTLIPPQQGSVELLKKDIAHQPNDVRQQLGIVFQAPSLDGQLTVEENLKHQGHLYGVRGEALKRRIHDLLREFKLEERKKDKVNKLSGGLKRRVEIAKSLIHNPKLLILDEPSTGLDPVARLDLWYLLRQLNQTHQTTILLTTHFMEEAERCDSLGIMDEGHLIARGTPHELTSQVGKAILEVSPSNKEEMDKIFSALKKEWGEAVSQINHKVRIEREDAPSLAAPLMKQYSAQIAALELKKPTLEDVFIHLTGHSFQREEEEALKS